MPTITRDYLETVPEVYKDILGAFPRFDPTRGPGDTLAMQAIFSVLDDKYTLGEVRAACHELAKGGAVEISHGSFVNPTELGERLIEAMGFERRSLPPFVPPSD